MYHYNNARCTKTCTLIYKALVFMLKNGRKGINKITVTDISRMSTVSRATFYRHFDSVVDVLVWRSDIEVASAFDHMVLAKDNRLFVNLFFEYWHKHSLLLDVLVAAERPDILLTSLEKIIGKYSYKLFVTSDLSPRRQQYKIGIWSVIIWMILRRWVIEGKNETAEELAMIALHSLPEP